MRKLATKPDTMHALLAVRALEKMVLNTKARVTSERLYVYRTRKTKKGSECVKRPRRRAAAAMTPELTAVNTL